MEKYETSWHLLLGGGFKLWTSSLKFKDLTDEPDLRPICRSTTKTDRAHCWRAVWSSPPPHWSLSGWCGPYGAPGCWLFVDPWQPLQALCPLHLPQKFHLCNLEMASHFQATFKKHIVIQYVISGIGRACIFTKIDIQYVLSELDYKSRFQHLESLTL